MHRALWTPKGLTRGYGRVAVFLTQGGGGILKCVSFVHPRKEARPVHSHLNYFYKFVFIFGQNRETDMVGNLLSLVWNLNSYNAYFILINLNHIYLGNGFSFYKFAIQIYQNIDLKFY